MGKVIGIMVGIVMFLAIVISGLVSNNPPKETLSRAIIAMGIGYLFGWFIGGTGISMIRKTFEIKTEPQNAQAAQVSDQKQDSST